jgi:glycosyltransferase involved in cell wall biosynthesis
MLVYKAMGNMQKEVLFLCDEIMPYFEGLFYRLYQKFNCKITAIEITKRKRTVYEAGKQKYYQYFPKEGFKKFKREILKIAKPDIVYVAGWINWDYLKVCRFYKKNGVPVLCGVDNTYSPSIKGFLKKLVLKYFLKRFITHLWIPGIPQFYFAKKIGFSNTQIIWNLYSADTEKFSPSKLPIKDRMNMLFVGRLEPIKGLDLLLNVFCKIAAQFPEWNLIIIGSGTMKSIIPDHKQIQHHSFMSSEQLSEIADSCSVFVLPSREEPWGLVIHEFACKGLALLTSNICGASSAFVINHFNGFTFKSDNSTELTNRLYDILSMNPNKLQTFCNNSLKLSNRITPDISIASLMTVVYK